MSKIIVYGAPWCADCRRSLALLEKDRVQYDYIDIDAVAGAADKVAEINGGMKSIPTIVFDDGTVLVEPSNAELSAKLAAIH